MEAPTLHLIEVVDGVPNHLTEEVQVVTNLVRTCSMELGKQRSVLQSKNFLDCSLSRKMADRRRPAKILCSQNDQILNSFTHQIHELGDIFLCTPLG